MIRWASVMFFSGAETRDQVGRLEQHADVTAAQRGPFGFWTMAHPKPGYEDGSACRLVKTGQARQQC